MFSRRWIQLAVVVGCVVLCSCKDESKQTTSQESSYSTLTLAPTSKEYSTSYSATIRGRQDIDIYPQVSGTMFKLCVSEGQKVSKGQVLFIIDQVPYQAALNTAIANVEAAKASVATAKLNWESNQELYDEKVISEFTLKTAHNEYLSACAQLAQAKAQEVNARNSLSYTEVKAPANGVVGSLPYKVGTLVSAQMAQPLTTVSDNSSMHVYFSMTENELLNLTRKYGSINEALASMPEVSLKLNDGSIYEEKGKIVSISGVIDRQTGSVTARAEFPNEKRLLNSGANGTVIIPATYENVLVIPQAATVQNQDKYIVYKVVDGKAKSTLVEVSPVSDGKEFVVTSGLKAGDVIVSAGAGLLRDGMQIN